ncbi:hypothetical protein [Streptomyces sp. NBC_01422]|uniref:hypothetical protein n=1 Tax=Streptomyces sp. NBC_01422 TaxID=2903859 RepID=UPI002E2E80E5|nr:hypothetical protein [Streptomyces sp. NBC_01422]
MSLWSGLVAAIGAFGMVVAGMFTARATTRAAQATAAANQAAAAAQAAPALRTADLAVLQATVERLDKDNGVLRSENEQIRVRQSRTDRFLQAFSWTLDDLYRWARNPIGPPPNPHPLVDEYNRTGV